jgi:hypothetical protein
LNPYEHLNLHFDAQPEDVKRQYRKARFARPSCAPLLTARCFFGWKISLMVHPDKCKHPRAREAFEGASALSMADVKLTVVCGSSGEGARAAAG